MKIWMYCNSKKIFFVFFMFLLFIKSAFAVDAEQFAQRLKTLTNKINTSFSYSKAVADNKDIIISDIAVIVQDVNDNKPISFDLGDMRFENVQEDKNGNYLVTRVYKENFVATAKLADRTIAVGNLEIKNIILPKGYLNEYIGNISSFQEFTVNNLIYNDHKNQITGSLEKFYLKLSLLQDDVLEIIFSEKNINMPVKKNILNDQNIGPILLMLGYERVVGDINVHVYYDGKTGNVTLEDNHIDFSDIGRLSFNLTAKIPTLDMFKQLKTYEGRYKKDENIDDNNPSDFLIKGFANGLYDERALLTVKLMNAFTLSQIEIKYQDYSLLHRLLERAEKTQNVKKEQIALLAKIGFSQLNYFFEDKRFINETAEKIEKFINDPQSITIHSEPNYFNKLYLIIPLAYLSPEDFIKILNLSIAVNDKK